MIDGFLQFIWLPFLAPLLVSIITALIMHYINKKSEPPVKRVVCSRAISP